MKSNDSDLSKLIVDLGSLFGGTKEIAINDENDDEFSVGQCVGVKSCTMESGGRKCQDNPPIKLHLNGNPGKIHIDFDQNW